MVSGEIDKATLIIKKKPVDVQSKPKIKINSVHRSDWQNIEKSDAGKCTYETCK